MMMEKTTATTSACTLPVLVHTFCTHVVVVVTCVMYMNVHIHTYIHTCVHVCNGHTGMYVCI